MKKRGVLIFSGYNHRGIVAFCRFCTQHVIPFFIVAAGDSDIIFLSDYKKNVIVTRTSAALNVEDIITCKDQILKDNAVADLIILPSTEYLNRFLLANRQALEAEGLVIPLCQKSLYEQVSDKYSFGRVCQFKNLSIPKEYDEPGVADIPFVAKPRQYFNGQLVNQKPILVTDEKIYRRLKKEKNADFYYQEFVGGESYYLLYYFSKDQSYSVYSQENLIQQHNGLSIIAARSASIHEDRIAKSFASLLSAARYRGLIMIEVKYYKNQFYMIEANPRLWGPSQLIVDAGMNLFCLFAYDNGLINELPEAEYEAGKKYFWTGGIAEDQNGHHAAAFHNYSKSAFFDEYAEWCKADVYLRSDTLPIFQKELIG